MVSVSLIAVWGMAGGQRSVCVCVCVCVAQQVQWRAVGQLGGCVCVHMHTRAWMCAARQCVGCVCVHMHTRAWICAARQVRWRAVGQFWRECVCVDVCSSAGAVEGSRAVCRVCVCACVPGCAAWQVQWRAVGQHGRCVCVQHGRCGGRLWGSMEGVCVCVDVCRMVGAVEGCGAVLEGVCVRGCVRHGRCGGGL